MAPLRVLLLCGGQSEEHEVSLASARSVMASANDYLQMTVQVISKTGQLLPPAVSRGLLSEHPQMATTCGETLSQLEPAGYDLIFPLLHGPRGEDGTVQGLLTLLGIPFVGSGVLGSAVGMDKPTMKRIFAAYGLPQVDFIALSRHSWQTEPEGVLRRAATLNDPLFVKPANLGSSVGISKVTSEAELKTAITEALCYDRRVIIEAGVVGVRELEVAVLGNDTPVASVVGEIRYNSSFYDYHAKYTEGEAQLAIPASIPKAVAERCRQLATEAFLAIDAAGLARVDFFYQEATGELFINEINTMPGFTQTSMYPKLWEASGLGYPELIERLIELALERR
jgi:D-alanine-D-alanine ligase